MVTAELKNYRQSPRKVRLIADIVRGKDVQEALDTLVLTIKRASDPIAKLINSAVANAEHNHGLKKADLFIKNITVDDGITLHRWRARARGRAAPIRKRTCIVKVVLDTKDNKK
jgi:large subunit ribosomal protein L22